MIVALSFSEAPYFAPCRAKGKIGHTYPTLPHKAQTGDLSQFVGAKTPPDIVVGGESRFVTTFRKRFWGVTAFYGFFKKIDIDIAGRLFVC